MLKTFVKRLVFFGIAVGTLLLATAIGMYSYLSYDLPNVKSLRNVTFNEPLRIYDRNGVLLTDYGSELRHPATYDQFPKTLRDAVVAIEDRRFYTHHGIDPKGIARAVFVLVTSGHLSQGASTITQQVARNFFLNNRKEFVRKLREIILAIKMDRVLTKQEILELYMNKIYLGNRSYGFVSAAKTYFNKKVEDLTLSEAALLAGVQQSPARINPIASVKRATERRNQVLYAMLTNGYITKEQYNQALNEVVNVNPGNGLQTDYISELARQALYDKFGDAVYNSGFRVYTTIDKQTQQAATLAVRENLLDYSRRHGWRGVKIHFWSGDKNPYDLETLKVKLRKIPRYDPIYPVVILSSNAKTAVAYGADGNKYTLDLDSVSWAGKYIDANTMGDPPTKVSDILSPGDVVYISSSFDSNLKIVNTLQQLPVANSGLISIDARNGSIQALVGGFSYHISPFNRATQAAVQVGSTIKPFVYADALENGFTLGTIIDDSPIAIKLPDGNIWRPSNFGNNYVGPITLRQALAQSRNIVAVKVARDIGLRNLGNFLLRFGFTQDEFKVTNSLALGALNFTPLEMARAYATFDNGGFLINPYLISKVVDNKGTIVFEANPQIACTAHTTECLNIPSIYSAKDQKLKQTRITSIHFNNEDDDDSADNVVDNSLGAVKDTGKVIDIVDDINNSPYAPRVLDGSVAWLMHNALQTDVWGGPGYVGTGRKIQVLKRHDVGGKTGTTNDSRATWFIGYAGPFVTATYTAFDTNEMLGKHEQGALTALPAWLGFEKYQTKNLDIFELPTPTNLVKTNINPHTGLLDPDGYLEYFINGTQPTQLTPQEDTSDLENSPYSFVPTLPSDQKTYGNTTGVNKQPGKTLFVPPTLNNNNNTNNNTNTNTPNNSNNNSDNNNQPANPNQVPDPNAPPLPPVPPPSHNKSDIF